MTTSTLEGVLRQMHGEPSYVEFNVHPILEGGVDIVATDGTMPGPSMPVARVHLPQWDVDRIAWGRREALRLLADVRRWLLRDLRSAQELALGIRGEV